MLQRRPARSPLHQQTPIRVSCHCLAFSAGLEAVKGGVFYGVMILWCLADPEIVVAFLAAFSAMELGLKKISVAIGDMEMGEEAAMAVVVVRSDAILVVWNEWIEETESLKLLAYFLLGSSQSPLKRSLIATVEIGRAAEWIDTTVEKRKKKKKKAFFIVFIFRQLGRLLLCNLFADGLLFTL
ncbi:hypothetical protein L1887_03607 [Cichorium endivia]|nr:hypothetical protein L1887_03607 [Cichorium endivia]